MPMLPACAEFRNSSRITFAAYGSAITSTSAFSALAITSRQKRSIAPCVCPLRLSHSPSVSVESAGTGRISAPNARTSAILSARVKAFAGKQLRQPMQRRRQPTRRPKHRPPPARLDHRHRARPVNALRNADAPVKPNQIRAAAKQHMLAVVDHLIHARMQIRTRPPAQVAAPLHQLHAQPGLGQRARRAHAGHAAANHDHRLAYDQPLNSLTLSSVPHKCLFYHRPCRCIAACAAIVANSARAPSSKRRPNFKGTQRSEASQALVMGLMRASVWLE